MAENEKYDSASSEQTSFSPEQRELLAVRFVGMLLPPLPKRHRCLANEVNYLCTTVSRLMLQLFGFRVDKAVLTKLLVRRGYTFFTRSGTCDPFTRRAVKMRQGCLFDEMEQSESPDDDAADEDAYVYVNVNGKVVRALRCLTIPTPPNISPDKLAFQTGVKARVDWYVKQVPRLLANENIEESEDKAEPRTNG